MDDLREYVVPVWAVMAGLALVGIGFAVRAEGRAYAARGRGRAWGMLRFATLPIALATVAAVILPARAVGGPEALAAFYLLMFTAGPAVYFGLHWVGGRILGLAKGEAVRIAASGLAMVLVPVLLANVLQAQTFEVARALQAFRLSFAADRPFPHAIVARQRYTLPDVGEVWTEHWQAAAGVKLERLEIAFKDDYARLDASVPGYLCRNGQDVHLIWPTPVPPPRWRVHWRVGDSPLARSQWTSVPPAGPAVPFEVRWLPDGFALPARIPRDIVSVGRTWADGKERVDALPPLGDGRSLLDTCMPEEFRTPRPAVDPVITSLWVRVWRMDTQQLLRAPFRRPAPAAPLKDQ